MESAVKFFPIFLVLGFCLSYTGCGHRPRPLLLQKEVPGRRDANASSFWLYNRGVYLDRLGRLEDAIASYRDALEMDYFMADAHYNLGYDLITTNQYPLAHDHLIFAYWLEPGAADIRRNLEIAFYYLIFDKIGKNNLRAADSLLSDLEQVVPGSSHLPLLKYSVGLAFLKKKGFDHGIARLDQAALLFEGDSLDTNKVYYAAQAQYAMGRLYALGPKEKGIAAGSKRERLVKAARHLNAAAALRTDVAPRALYYLGKTYAALGRMTQASGKIPDLYVSLDLYGKASDAFVFSDSITKVLKQKRPGNTRKALINARDARLRCTSLLLDTLVLSANPPELCQDPLKKHIYNIELQKRIVELYKGTWRRLNHLASGPLTSFYYKSYGSLIREELDILSEIESHGLGGSFEDLSDLHIELIGIRRAFTEPKRSYFDIETFSKLEMLYKSAIVLETERINALKKEADQYR